MTEKFRKVPNLTLVAARGDLYVEISRPHLIANALRLIASKDPEACVGSRFMLSVMNDPVPSCADFTELAWVRDIGFRSVMLCDELCLKGELLERAVHACRSFYDDYQPVEQPTASSLSGPSADTSQAPSRPGRRWWPKFLS